MPLTVAGPTGLAHDSFTSVVRLLLLMSCLPCASVQDRSRLTWGVGAVG